jgi:hypothetical protein
MITWLNVNCDYQIFVRDTCSSSVMGVDRIRASMCTKSTEGKYFVYDWNDSQYVIRGLGFDDKKLTLY